MLNVGTKLGSYEVTGAIGAGGMGEVYRARDTNLGRDVAIKVLPEAFTRDPDRMARFGREAKLLAALDHSNIASIYGLETSGNARALVMQLAEGPTLAERIAQGPLPIDDALRIAKQICDALEYAHEKGIIHRDLKPANIKVADDDMVKILDFGLAKALESGPSTEDIANSPTLSRMATQTGVLLGTAAYMSPEQAKAKPVDRRADIWAFGCVLYEMLTGKKAFPGDAVTEILAAVLKNEPDWSLLPSATPMRVRVLLQRCLQKDPKQRLRDIGDARISLDEVLAGAPEAATGIVAAARPWWLWAVSGVAGFLALGMALFAFLYFHRELPASPITRFEIPVPEKTSVEPFVAVSPDGSKLAFIGTGAGGTRLWVRSLETMEARPLDGTEGMTGWPIWSPDSRFIAFSASGKLKKIESTGSPPVTLCDAPAGGGGVWTSKDMIVFGSNAGIQEVSASGGSPSSVTTGGASINPSLLPDGRHFIYWRGSPGGSGIGIYVGSLDGKSPEASPKKLLPDVSPVVAYAPSSDPSVGYLLFVRGATTAGASGTLMAQPFDTRRLELTGEAVPIAERVSNLSFSASASGVLIYVAGSSTNPENTQGGIQGQLAWFDRSGRVLGTFGDPGLYRTVALSPNGKRVAFDRPIDPRNPTQRNIWLYDFERGVSTRFTFDSGWDSDPVWSSDGGRIAFSSERGEGFNLYQKVSNLTGEDELLFKASGAKLPSSWSPDGRFLLFFRPTPPTHVWLLPLGGTAADRKPISFSDSPFNIAAAHFSPDGRWIAYSSDESGRNEIYVRPFDVSSVTDTSAVTVVPETGKWQVSIDGGTNPHWSRDGKEIFFLSSVGGMMMSVPVNTSGTFQAGVPKALFKVPAGVLFYDVSADGKRFLMAAPSGASASTQPPFTVVLNWEALLKK
jgi:eukaryotic-like serine/threonine-protein kinase